jgi:cell wall-associated NlpC family hydrolase
MSRDMSRVALAVLAVLGAVLAVPGVAGARTWDAADQRTVMRAGLLAPLSDGRFHGERPLTYDELRASRDALALTAGTERVLVPGHGNVRVTAFDAALVRQLGLSDVADAVRGQARRGGLHPPAYFGTEVVARALSLRFNHPYPRGEALEAYPWQAISRAEAAYSLARIAGFSGWEAGSVRDTFSRFVLPRYTRAQRGALRLAVSKIGMPYIWGGETDGVSVGQIHGGYDCSGFAWRVFGATPIGGRTADDQAHGIAKRARVRFDAIRPGDLLFFGERGYARHEGIALGASFMIHASAQGVYVSSLEERWRRDAFLWGRRLLR